MSRDDFFATGFQSRLSHFFHGDLRIPQGDVGRHCSPEKKIILMDDADASAEILLVKTSNVHSVHNDVTGDLRVGVQFVKPLEKIDYGAFPAAGTADDGDTLTRLNLKADVFE